MLKVKIIFESSFYGLIRKDFLLVFILLCLGNCAMATIGTSAANSNWTNAGTWTFNGSNRLPNCGDSISVGSSHTVTVNSQVDYTACSGPMIIYVYGILEFTNGNKLDLPCGSVVFIMSGGLIRKSTAGGGSSTLISICGITEWKAGDGPLSGVDTLGNVINLPVELINFEAEKINSGVKLMWSTATEVDNDYFILEKSSNGQHFTEIAKIIGAGNSSFTTKYSYTDNSPLEGISYYRLSQVDFDGKRVTFPPVPIRTTGKTKNEVQILRNLFNNTIEFSTAEIRSGNLQVSLFSSEGRKVIDDYRDAAQNTLYKIDNLESLSNGFYLLQIRQEGQLIHSSGLIKH